MAKVLVLKVITGPQLGKTYTITSRNAIIGSGSGCDMVVHDRLIEPRHAEVRHMLDSWFIVPLAGDRGIAINGMVVGAQGRIRPGDQVTIGSTTYTAAVEEVIEREVGNMPSAVAGVPQIGQYMVERGILTTEQVRRTVEQQATLRRKGITKQFGEVAQDLGFVSRGQLERVLADQRNDFNTRWRD